MSAILIDAWVGGIHVAVQVSIIHRRSRGPVGRAHVVHAIHTVVVHLDVPIVGIAMDGVVAADIVDVDVAIDDPPIDRHVLIAIVHINVVDMDMRPAAIHPAAAVPTVIVNAVIVPIAVAIEPRADEKTRAKGDGQSPGRPPVIADIGIINGDIDVLGLIGNDADVVVLYDHLVVAA